MDTPLDKLFLETDSNLEHNIGEVYTTVALLKNITMQELQLQLKRNFNTIFTASL
jgi:Tat protein secretion system quality control protein TatD with DNase activity